MPTPCSENEQCIELLGNYTCECKSGYSRVGQICMGKSLISLTSNTFFFFSCKWLYTINYNHMNLL